MGFAIPRESGAAKADRLAGQQFKSLGWKGADLAARRKSDPDKLAMVARLRRETTLSLRAIAARVCLGSSQSANALLHRWMRASANKSKDNPSPK